MRLPALFSATDPATDPAADPPVVPGRRPAWQRRWLRHRRLLAAALAGVVVWSLATALAPPAPPTSPVVVAARDLVPGTLLTESDVRREQRTAVPVDATADPGPVIGRTLAFPVRADEPVLARHVLGADLLAGYPAGTVATAVPLGEAGITPSLAAGDLVDVIAASAADLDPEGSARAAAATVAQGVRVLLAPRAAGDGTGLLGGGSPAGSALVVAASTEQALAIAQAGVRARLVVVLRGRT